ncbi:zinc ribbon domain-containing protein [Patescibacteria group bacterium]
MANCSKCNDPISPGETFCGKCGAPLPVHTSQPAASPTGTVGPSPAAGQPATHVPKLGGSKKLLWIILAVVAVAVVVLILWFTGVLGGSAAVSNYVKNTAPDFKAVSDSLGSLDKALTYESSGDVEQDLLEMETELSAIDSARTAVATAEVNLQGQRVTSQVQKLDTDLRSFYTDLKTDLDYRYDIVNYFYTAEQVGDRIARSVEDEDYADIYSVREGFDGLKDAIDSAVLDLEDMEVPDVLQEVHQTDIDILKRMSSILGDMVREIDMMDDVGLTASLSQFEALMSEYDTKVTQQYEEILEPEFAALNDALQKEIGKKDVIEDEYAQLKGRYNIKTKALDFIR